MHNDFRLNHIYLVIISYYFSFVLESWLRLIDYIVLSTKFYHG